MSQRVLLGIGLLVAGLAWTQPVGASGPCGPTVTAWVSDAQINAPVRVDAVACAPGRVRLRLLPEGAAPLDVEVAEPPGPAFRHAGRLRISPIVEISDYQLLPKVQRDAFERLVTWVAAHEARVVLVGSSNGNLPAPPSGIGIGNAGGGLVVTALALALMARWLSRTSARPGARRLAVTAAGLFALALALRFGLGVWGPHHINGQGPLWIAAVLEDPSRLASYGPGYAELFGALARAAPIAPDRAIFAANAVFSALAPALAFGLGRVLGQSFAKAALAGGFLAADSAAIRAAATESYFPSIVTLTLGGALLLAMGAAAAARRERLRAGLLAAAGALLCAQAARVHPVAWGPVALAPLVTLIPIGPEADSAERIVQWRGRLLRAALAAGLVAGVVLVTSGSWIFAVASAIPTGRSGIGASGDVADTLAVLLVAAPCVLLPRIRWLGVVAALHVVLLVNTRRIYGQSEIWQASFDRLYLIMPTIAAAALIPEAWSRRLTSSWLAPAALVGLLLPAMPAMRTRTTEQHEYAFLRAQLRALDPGCRVAHVGRAHRRVLALPDYVASPVRRSRLDAATSGDIVAALGESPCIHYIRTSLCASAEGRPACEAVENGLALEPAAWASFPSLPSYDALGYEEAEVEVVIFRVLGAQPELER